MRTVIAIVLAMMCVLMHTSCAHRATEAPCEFAAAESATMLTADEPGEPGSSSPDDLARLSRIADEGTRLIEAGHVTKMTTLIEQLKQERHHLELPKPRVLGSEEETFYPQARDSVVILAGLFKCKKCSLWHSSPASGFVLTSGGVIVTNYHVVNAPEMETLIVMTIDQRVFPVVRVLAANRAADLAVLQIDATGLAPLTLATAPDAAPVGSAVHLVSHPANRFYSYTAGVVSRHMQLRSSGTDIAGLSITADYARGSSGAPVLNNRGQVVAIVRSTESVYHSAQGNKAKHVQMVFKDCVAVQNLLPLVTAESKGTPSK